MENELEKALESKFFCPARFAQEIEGLVQVNKNMNYIDAIVYKQEIIHKKMAAFSEKVVN